MIETLKNDLKQVIAAIPENPSTAKEVVDYVRDNLVPFVQNVVDELGEIDDCVSALVQESEDILHEDNAGIFAGVVTAGQLLVEELRARANSDKRIATLIREYEIVAAKATQILEDIVVPDEIDDANDVPDDAGSVTP